MTYQRWAIQIRDNGHYWASAKANPHLFATRSEARAARANIDPDRKLTKVAKVDVSVFEIETWQ